MKRSLKTSMNELSPKRILDVATGSGSFIKWTLKVLDDFQEIIGIDESDAAITRAKKEFHQKNISFQKMNSAELTFGDATFDLVIISNSLHHLSNVPHSLAEAKRVLRPGGCLLIVEMCRDGQNEKQQTFVDMHHWWAEIDRLCGVSHNETLRSEEIIDLVRNLNLESFEIFDDLGDTEGDPESEFVEFLIEHCNSYPKKIETHPMYEIIERRGEKLKTRIKDIGSAAPSQVIVLARK